MRVLALLLIAVPIVFGALRLGLTGDDARYLLTAFASTAGAAAWLWRAGPRRPVTARRVALAAITATAAAMTTAGLAGARSVPAITIVSAGFAVCSALGFGLWARQE